MEWADRALNAMAPGIEEDEWYPFERPFLTVASRDFDATANAFEHAGLAGEVTLATPLVPLMDDEIPVMWRR